MEQFSIGRTVARTFTLASDTIASVGIFVLAVSAASTGYQLVAQPRLREAMMAAQDSSELQTQLGLFLSPWYWAGVVVPLVLGALIFAGAFDGLLKAADQGTASLGACFRSGFAKLPAMLAMNVLWYIGIVFGLMFFIIPGLALLAMWSASAPALVGEDLNAIASLGRSRQLTRGSRIKILLLLFLFLVLAYGLVFGVTMAGFGMNFTGLGTIASTPSYQLAMLPGGWATSFLTSALLASIYVETVQVREGGRSGELAQVFG